jgi:Lrp/AsnC family leucine-responsive transcriptional regulator
MPSIQKTVNLDDSDWQAVKHLIANARITWADLGSALGLSAPAAADRVKKLEQAGVIRGYTALVDHEQLGAEVTAFVAVRLERPRHREGFLRRVKSLEAILECHHVAGEDDFLLKVRAGRLKDLEELVSVDLKGVEGVVGTRTTIVLSTVKETLAPPLKGPRA